MKIRPYDHDSQDQRFVFSTFCLQTGEPRHGLADMLQAGAKAVVAGSETEKRSDGSDLLYGWAASIAGELVYAYVKHDVRHFPVIPALVKALSIDTSKTIVVHFDSVAIRTMMGAFRWSYRLKEIEHGRPETD